MENSLNVYLADHSEDNRQVLNLKVGVVCFYIEQLLRYQVKS